MASMPAVRLRLSEILLTSRFQILQMQEFLSACRAAMSVLFPTPESPRIQTFFDTVNDKACLIACVNSSE